MKHTFWEQFPFLIAATSTRHGGVSLPPYDSLNLSFTVGDDPMFVRENRKRWLEDLGIKPNQVVFTKQGHTSIITEVHVSDGGRGYESFDDGITGDALYTKDRNLYLAIYHADCVPIFFCSPKHDLVRIIHAGDKGTLNGATSSIVRELIAKENLEPRDLYFMFGPSVSFGHNELSEEDALKIAAMDKVYARGIKRSMGVYFLDTPFINFLQLRELGVPVENITVSGICTHENDDTFFAAGKTHPTGRNVSYIARL